MDELGGLDRALEMAKRMAGLRKNSPVKIVSLPRRQGWLNLSLGGVLSMDPQVQESLDALAAKDLFQDNRMLAIMPFAVEIR